MNVCLPHDQCVVQRVIERSEYHGLIYLEGVLIGFIFLGVNDYELHVCEFYIDDQYRNHGIGQRIVSKLDQMAKDLDVPYITLGVSAANPAMSLYNKNGFIPRYIEMVKAVG